MGAAHEEINSNNEKDNVNVNYEKLNYINSDSDSQLNCRMRYENSPKVSPHTSSDCFERRRLIVNNQPKREEPPFYIVICCYLSYSVLILFGYLRDFLRNTGIERNKSAVEANRPGYTPLYKNWQRFFSINIFKRACDAFSQPICGVPGGVVEVANRYSDDYNWSLRYTNETTEAVNLGSYNYLGFAQNNGIVADNVENTMRKYGIGMGSTHHELGKLNIHNELEDLFARFLGTESSIVFGMGFATNSTNIPTLAGKDCLIIGDELNHASLKLGCHLSGSSYTSFRHNDMKDLERKLRNSIINGIPRKKRSWKKIIIIVEGIYSMEGSIANLPELIRLKKRYKCYLYVDEAHSIGAIGNHGKGIVDYYGCDPKDIDLLMGTLTKSFGASGGYIAGPKEVIDHIRIYSHSLYATSMAPPIVQQIMSVLKVILGEEGGDDGQLRVNKLAKNVLYFRERLHQLGFIVNGHPESPVVPIMIYLPAIIPAFVRYGLKKGIATVGAGYPATSLTTCRIRFCMSAAHTEEMLEKSIDVISELGDEFRVKYANYHTSFAFNKLWKSLRENHKENITLY